MNIREASPKDLIESSWYETYEDHVELIWEQLIRLNSSIFILENLLSFPFDLFLPGPRYFWNLVEEALFETCVMTIWRVAVDSSFEEGLTIRQLKNEILQHLNSDENREEFKRLLRKVNFDQAIARVEPVIREIRHSYIAHFHLEKHVNPPPEERVLLFSEVQKFRDALNSLFELLCFGHGKATLPFEYHPDLRYPKANRFTDIELLLDNVAQYSPLLNMPEQNPTQWVHTREKLKDQEIEMLNKYRVRFGLSRV